MRQKVCLVGIALVFITTAFILSAHDAEAAPAFARQTGLSCSTCHFQHFPALNAFGRSFKAGGYTMVGGQSLIEGDMLSVPSVLNASMVLKVMYQKQNGDDDTLGKNKGDMKFPDEAAFFLGGRVGEHVGFVLEFAHLGSADTGNGDIVATTDSIDTTLTNPHSHNVTGTSDTGSGDLSLFASFKMPFVYDVRGVKLNIIPFSTDALGVPFGFELLNTGAVRNVRILEHRKDISAQQFIGTDGEAEGLALVAYNDKGFINASLWAPVHGTFAVGSFSNYLRVAATPMIGDWDLAGGFQYWGGTSKNSSVDGDDNITGTEEVRTHAWALDFQAQGTFMSKPLGAYATYGIAEKTDGTIENMFNDKPNDKTAWALNAELGVLPGKATVTLGYRSGDNGKSSDNEETAVIVGATYLPAQNIQLLLNHSLYSGNAFDPKPGKGDQLTSLQLFTSF